jgi:hypothetical protein
LKGSQAMTEKSREDTIRDMVDWLGSMQSLANIPDDESDPNQPDQLVDRQARCAQLECLVQQVSEHLATLLRSMTESVAALQRTAAPCQQNHLFVLETQITYLQRLAHDLMVVAELETTNESE